jgi:DNA uptake protein ComE-like DNA-binding protein
VKIKLNMEPVKNWLGFTRRERRSTSILLAIIFIIIGFRFVVPEQNIEIENWGVIPADTGNVYEISDSDISENLNQTVGYGKVDGVAGTTYENTTPGVAKSYSSSRKAAYRSSLQQKPLLNINDCDSLALIGLPGIGPVLSARIIKYRNLLGGYARVEQLKEVYGLPEETYEMIKGRLYADSSDLRKISINSGGSRELSHIPYLEKYEVTAILKYREITGRVKSIQELKDNKILTPDKAEKVEPYLDFR